MFQVTSFVKRYTITALLAIFFIAVPFVCAISPEAPVITKSSIIVDDNKKSLQVEGKSEKDTEVLVYINDKFFGTTITNKERFVFSQNNFLLSGRLKIVVVARNSATQELSGPSNAVSPVQVVKPAVAVKKPVVKIAQPELSEETKAGQKDDSQAARGEISEEAVNEEQPVVKGIEETYNEEDQNEETVKDSADSMKTLEEILSKDSTEQEATTTGIISETKEQLSKIKLNIFIFLIFLAAVIAWIIWVNRELIKEKQEENNKDNHFEI